MTTIEDRGLLIGERFADDNDLSEYVIHPTDGWLGDGDPLDAGSAQALDQNLSHVSYQSTRVLCVAKGPGTSHYVGGGIGPNPDGYDNLRDVNRPLNPGGLQSIAWDGNTSSYLGTFPLVLDGDPSNTTTGSLRWVRVVLRYNANSGSSTRFFAVLTYDGANPWNSNVLASRAITGSAGTNTAAIDLVVFRAIAAGQGRPWQCRPSGENGLESIVFPVSLWVGWKMEHSADSLLTISAYEVRVREI